MADSTRLVPDTPTGPGGGFLISRSVLGPGIQNRRAGGRKQKQENRGPEGGPGPQGSSGLVPRWGEGGGRDGSVGRPDGRRAPSVGLTNGAVGAVGVGCTVAWAAKVHALSLVLRGFGYEIAPAARCFCFLNRGPGPSDGAGGGALTERSKNLRLVPRCVPAWVAAGSMAATRNLMAAAASANCAVLVRHACDVPVRASLHVG